MFYFKTNKLGFDAKFFGRVKLVIALADLLGKSVSTSEKDTGQQLEIKCLCCWSSRRDACHSASVQLAKCLYSCLHCCQPLMSFFCFQSTGIVVYNSFLKTVRLRRLMLWGSLLGCALGLTPLLLVEGVNRKLGISDRVFALVDSALLSSIGQVRC